MRLWYKLLNWFYGTTVGGLYFELLLWIDRQKSSTKYLTPKEMAQIIRESSKVGEGLVQVKQKVNALIKSKSKEEYQAVLKEVVNLIPLSEGDKDSDKAKFVEFLKHSYVKKGDKDIVTATDRAKMVEQRIQDMYALQEDRVKRGMLREARKLRQQGDLNKAAEIEQEYVRKYGRNRQQRH